MEFLGKVAHPYQLLGLGSATKPPQWDLGAKFESDVQSGFITSHLTTVSSHLISFLLVCRPTNYKTITFPFTTCLLLRVLS